MKESADRGPHPREPHVVGPDDERKKSQDQSGKDERFVTPEGLARIVSDNFGNDAHAGQDQDVNFRMTEEPKQMLPQKRAATAAEMQWRSVHDQSAWHEKAGGSNAVHQLHDDSGLKRRKREEQEKGGNKLCPDEKGQAHPGQPRSP